MRVREQNIITFIKNQIPSVCVWGRVILKPGAFTWRACSLSLTHNTTVTVFSLFPIAEALTILSPLAPFLLTSHGFAIPRVWS